MDDHESEEGDVLPPIRIEVNQNLARAELT